MDKQRGVQDRWTRLSQCTVHNFASVVESHETWPVTHSLKWPTGQKVIHKSQCYYHDNERTSGVLPWPLLSCCCLQYRLQVMKPEWGLASFQGHSSIYVSAIFNILPHVNYNSRLITRAHEHPSYETNHNSLWLVSKATWRSLTHCWTLCQPCLLCIEFGSESDVLELPHGTDHTHTTQ